MLDDTIGYQDLPRNGDGIKRARTSISLRTWEFARDLEILSIFEVELQGGNFPGIYLLFEGSNRIYVGESSNLLSRLRQHISAPPDQIQNWSRVLIINDGRAASQSDFNDAVIRHEIENYLKLLLMANRKTIVSQAEPQTLNSHQRFIIDTKKKEIDILLMRQNIISKLLENESLREVRPDRLKRIFHDRNQEIEFHKNKVAFIDGTISFIRPGSEKRRGWQITFRDVFKDHLESGEGNLLVSRNGVLLIPLRIIQKLITDPSLYEQNTIDIYVQFEEESVFLFYRGARIEVTDYKILAG